jgi:hypothetical protein
LRFSFDRSSGASVPVAAVLVAVATQPAEREQSGHRALHGFLLWL